MLAPGYLWGAQGVSFYAGHEGRVALLAWKHHLPWLPIAAAAVTVAVMAGVQRPGQGEVPAGVRAGVPLGGDLIAFWTGARILADDGGATELYHRPRVLAELSRAFPERPPLYRLAYPPPVYQATSALLPLGYRWAAALQVVAMALLFGVGALGLAESSPTLAKRRLAAWALLAAGPAMVMTTVTGQLSGVWFVLLGGAVLAWSRGHRMGAGLLLGLLCAKPTLAAPVALALLIAGQGWALLGFVLGGGLLLVASLPVGGVGPWVAYLEMMRDTPDLTQRMWLHPARQFTLRTLLALPARGSELAAPLGWGSRCQRHCSQPLTCSITTWASTRWGWRPARSCCWWVSPCDPGWAGSCRSVPTWRPSATRRRAGWASALARWYCWRGSSGSTGR